LRFDEAEHPVALQLGGSDPEDLAKCAAMGAKAGYDEINLNCGCPSDRVQSGRFGACLMEEPAHVAACAGAMLDAADVPVTVKCRIGIDERDDFEFLDKFVDKIADKGVKTFIIHARKAWLKGLSPKQNREIPPLDYGRVAAIKEKHPQLRIILNGGITDIEAVRTHTQGFDGVMIGREAYSNPYFLAGIERLVFGNDKILDREDIARAMIPYAAAQADQFGTPVKSITRHILGLFHNQPGAKAWKRTLSTLPYEDGAAADVIERALCAQKEAADSQNAA
jgi:tRNA-dihydrouridine synthase A